MLYCDAVMFSHVVPVTVVLCCVVLLRFAVMKLWCDVLEKYKFKRAMGKMSSSNSGDAEPEVVQLSIEALHIQKGHSLSRY